jgi:hypothetical protein
MRLGAKEKGLMPENYVKEGKPFRKEEHRVLIVRTCIKIDEEGM